MKAEINNENKVKFFALYWGQKVFQKPILSEKPVSNIWVFEFEDPEDIEEEILWLKPLSQISDEDMKSLAEIEGYGQEGSLFGKVIREANIIYLLIIEDEEDYPNGRFNLFLNSGFLEYDNMKGYEDNRTCGVTSSSYDYLRSKGYALPWMGLSVEEMIKAGWIKLIES